MTKSLRFAGWRVLLLALVAAAPPPPAVVVAPVQLRDVTPVQAFIGQVQAIQTVTVVARVQAYIEKVTFQEGSAVKAGQVLFELQKGPYQAAVLQAQGALAQAQAALRNAQMNLERDERAGDLAISPQQIQQDTAARDVAAAQVDSARGALQAAAITLSYCTVSAPIDGRIGRALFTAGNLVDAGSGPLATIVQMDPIRVSFAVTGTQIVSMEQRSHESRQRLIDALVLTLRLSNGTAYGHPGKIEFLDNQVDPATGTITVWGRFPNPEGLLTPGAYASVEVKPDQPEERPLVAVQAVQNDRQGQFVLVVGADSKVAQRRITTGRQIEQDYIVESGLKGGERVIIEGVQKVHPGEEVEAVAASDGSAGAPGKGGTGGSAAVTDGG